MSQTSESMKKCLSELVKQGNADYFYLPSFDHNLSEYVPSSDSLRIFVTKFTGSVAEALVDQEGRVHLFVDGRYHEQADLECDLSLINIIKVPFGTSIKDELLAKLTDSTKVAVIAERTPFSLMDKVSEENLIPLLESEVFTKLEFESPSFSGPLWEVASSGLELFEERVKRILINDEKAFINAIDTLAWISGLRGNHLPYQGTFRGCAILTREKLHIFVSQELLSQNSNFETNWREFNDISKLESRMGELITSSDKVLIDSKFSTLKNYFDLKGLVGSENIVAHPSFHADWQGVKDSSEAQYFRDSFEKSDSAIYDSLVELIEKTRAGEKVSEKSFRDMVEKNYQGQGARCQSFRTISGFGPSSSIIHFGNPSESKNLERGEFVLVDSGAIYQEGYATDCTRTIIPLGEPNGDQILHYTLVLKGLIKVLMANFENGSSGSELDALARGPLQERGLDYAHGTGHGVGVNVHEAGYSLRPESTTPMQEGLVGSVEPGYYQPGVGGIRLENIVSVKKLASNKLGFENLVHIGFWHDLIDKNLLSEEEWSYLLEYEAICSKKGRSFSHYANSPLASR